MGKSSLESCEIYPTGGNRSLSEIPCLGTVTFESTKEAQLRSLAEDFDTRSSAGQMIFHVLGMLAEFERNRIRERTLEGLQAARERGRVGSRPPKLNDRQRELVRRMRRDGDSLRENARTLNVSVGTVTRVLRPPAITSMQGNA